MAGEMPAARSGPSTGLGADKRDQTAAHGHGLRIRQLRAGHRQNGASEIDDLRLLYQRLGDLLLLAGHGPETDQYGESGDRTGVAFTHHTSRSLLTG